MAGQKAYGRTVKSMRNSGVALFIQCLAMLVGFFSRKIFIDVLGTEVIGLQSTATSILNGLNVMELGIWAATSVTLYKPLFDDDRKKIKEIIALQGWLYKIIAILVIVGSFIVMCFFPEIFRKANLPLWYPYATFCTLLYSESLKYFVNYKRIALYASQQNYKVLTRSRLISVGKLILQAVMVKYSDHGFIWWLALEAINATISAFLTTRIINKDFPYLKESVEHPSSLRHHYPDVFQKIKYLAIHKLGGFAMSQISPIVIYGYTTLTNVALYGNYMVVVGNIYNVLGAIFTGMDASVGNLVAENDGKLIMKVYRELFSMKFFITGVCSVCLWLLTEPFISVWLGAQYRLGLTTLGLIIVSFMIGNIRSINDEFINAYGLFQDVWVPVAEGTLNIVFALVLGHYHGLNGILLASIISQFAIGFLWKPYFLFSRGFRQRTSLFVLLITKHSVVFAVAAALSVWLFSRFHLDPSVSIWAFLLSAIIVLSIVFSIFGVMLYSVEEGARGCVRRVLTVLSSKLNNK